MRKPTPRPSAGHIHPFPHFKLVNEAFPRLLATRRIVDDGSEYFGAFLNRTAVRIAIDFVNRTFKLRSCDIPIDGSFPVPCTQYYARRCVAPCVASLCSPAGYESTLARVRMFLLNERSPLRDALIRTIDDFAAELDFENAARTRDLLNAVESFWANPRWNVWLDDSVDTYRIGVDSSESLTLLSQRRGRSLGKHTFPRGTNLYAAMRQIYLFHGPREIRVPVDFPERMAYAAQLRKRFGRSVKIKVVANDDLPQSALRVFEISRKEAELQHLSVAASPLDTARRLRDTFRLARIPRYLEAYDVAHISATAFVAAVIARDIRRERTISFEHVIPRETSEPAALGSLVRSRHDGGTIMADILLIDGGAAQLKAARAVLPARSARRGRIIAAVKPAGRHSEISHFLTEDGERIHYDPRDGAHRLLLSIRDEVHELANSIHRLTRDMAPFYDLAAVLPSLDEAERQKLLDKAGSIKRILELSADKIRAILGPKKEVSIMRDITNYRAGNFRSVPPLIVPIRLDEPGGEAEDLRPIITR